jgi:hypothetical protein
MFGYVLTYARNVEELYIATKKIGADTIKVITAWGLPWDSTQEGNTRALIASLTPNTVIRTKSGDPSSNGTLYPIPDIIIQEIRPWYSVKRNIIIEIGNEPNVHSSTQDYVYIYKWYLAQTILRLRVEFPHAKIMSTALQPDKNVEYWHQIFSEDIYDTVDYVGVHAYEHRSFTQPITHHYDKMLSIFALQKSKLFFSELGINGANSNKLAEYKAIAMRFPVTYYHYNSALDIDPQYHVEVL